MRGQFIPEDGSYVTRNNTAINKTNDNALIDYSYNSLILVVLSVICISI